MSWMTGCTFIQAPCIFIFSGFFLVFLILWADGCASYNNLILQYIDGSGNDTCTGSPLYGTVRRRATVCAPCHNTS